MSFREPPVSSIPPGLEVSLAQIFRWVLGMTTQVLMLVQRHFTDRHLPGPLTLETVSLCSSGWLQVKVVFLPQPLEFLVCAVMPGILGSFFCGRWELPMSLAFAAVLLSLTGTQPLIKSPLPQCLLLSWLQSQTSLWYPAP